MAASQNADIAKALRRLPLSFEPNVGQTASEAKWVSRGSGYTVFLTDQEAVLRMKSANAKETIARIKFAGAKSTKVEGIERQIGYSNYYGGTRAEVREKVANFGAVRYSQVFPGVDTIFRGDETNLRFDYVVKPGADPKVIEIAYDGFKTVQVTPKGDLALDTGAGEIIQHKPYIYQQVQGKRVEIAGGYRAVDGGRIGFEIGAYDQQHELVIDPTLTAGTFVGGTGVDNIRGVAQDATNLYLVGDTTSTVFPSGQAGPKPGTSNGVAFAIIMPRNGTGPVVRTFIGTTQTTVARGVKLAGFLTGGNLDKVIYVVGDTLGAAGVTLQSSGATNFAGTVPAAGTTATYIVAIDTGTGAAGIAGTANFGVYLGGNPSTGTAQTTGNAIAVDATGLNVWVGGSTTNATGFPNMSGGTQAVYQGGSADGYVAYSAVTPGATPVTSVFSTTGQATYLGGAAADVVNALAYNTATNQLIVAGNTSSTAAQSFPSTAGTVQPQNGGGQDGFAVALNAVPAGINLTGNPVFGTFYGGPGTDGALGVALDATGNIFITGQTASSTAIATAGTYSTTLLGASDAYVAKLTPTGTRTYGTYLGGTSDDLGVAIAVDLNGQAYVAGQTFSADFPTPISAVGGTQPLQNNSAFAGPSAPFLARLDFFGAVLNYGGINGSSSASANDGAKAIALDSTTAANTAFIAGTTVGGVVVTTAPVPFQNSFQGSADGFVAGVRFNDLSLPLASPNVTAGSIFNFTQTGGVVPAAQSNIVTFNLGTPAVTVSAPSYATQAGNLATGWLVQPTVTGCPGACLLNVALPASDNTLNPGIYQAIFTLSGNFDNSPVNVTVNLTVNSTILVTSNGGTVSGGGQITRGFTKGAASVSGNFGLTLNVDKEVVSSLPNPLAFTAVVTSYGTAAAPGVPTGCSAGWLSVAGGTTVAAASASNFNITYDPTVLQSIDLTGLPTSGGGLPKCTATITYTIPTSTGTTTTTQLVEMDFVSRILSTPVFSNASPLTFNFGTPTSPAQNQTVFQTGDGLALPYVSFVSAVLTQSAGPTPAETCPAGALTVTFPNAAIAPDGNPANSGGTASSVVITVNPNLCNTAAGIPAQYTGTVTLASTTPPGGANVVIPVTVNVGNTLATTVPGGTANFVGLTNPTTLLLSSAGGAPTGFSINTDTIPPANTTFTVSGTNPNSAAFTYTTPVATTAGVNLGGAGTCTTSGANLAWLVATPATGSASNAAPDTVTLSVNSTAWQGLGSTTGGCRYQGTVTVTGAAVGVSPQVITVQFTKVTQPITSVPTAINFVGQVGQGLPISCTVTGSGTSGTSTCGVTPIIPVGAGGVPTLTYTMTGKTLPGVVGTGTPYAGYDYPADTPAFNGTTNPAGWLTFSPSPLAGIATASTATIGANLTNLAAGTYTGFIKVRNGSTLGTSFSGQSPVVIPVTLTLYGTPSLNITPTGTQSFSFTQGGNTALTPDTLTVSVATTNPVGATLTYTPTVTSAACGGSNWLVLAAGTGSAFSGSSTPVLPAVNDTFTLSVNPACLSGGTALAAGSYIGNVHIVAPQAAVPVQDIPVQLTITTPVISASPTTLSPFTYTIGGTSPANQTVSVSTTPAGLTVTAVAAVTTPSGGTWLSASLAGGTLTVTANPTGLAASSIAYTGTVTLSAPGAANVVFPVSFTVSATPVISVAPTAISTTAQINGPVPAQQQVLVTVANGTAAMTATTTITTPIGGSWLTATLSTSNATAFATLTLTFNQAGLAAGTYNANVAITSPNLATVDVPVTLTVTAQPVISVNGVPSVAQAFAYTLGNTTASTPLCGAPVSITGSSNGLVINPVIATSNGGTAWINTPTFTGGTTPTSSTICVTPGSVSPFAPGVYTGTVTMTSPNAVSAVVAITLTINAQPVISAPATAAYSYTWGSSTVTAAPVLNVTSTPTAASVLALTKTGSCAWLNAALAATTAPTTITNSLVTPLVMAPGTYTCTLVVNGTGGTPSAPAIASSTVVTLTVAPYSFFAAAQSVGNGVSFLTIPGGNLFGYFSYLQSNSILFHFDLGYESIVPANDASNGMYMYDFASGHWWYTNSPSFPFVYDFTLKAWIYYFPAQGNPGHYTTAPRQFVNTATGQFFTM